jgi:hypothetical protein
MPTTPNSKLPYPAATDPADVPADMQRLAVALDEIAYAEITADVNVTATAQASANTVVTAPAVTFDGTTVVYVEFQATRVETFAGNGAAVVIDLWDGSTDLGFLGVVLAQGGANSIAAPFSRARRLTPSAAAHTYSIRAWQLVGNGVIRAVAPNLPAFIRIKRA